MTAALEALLAVFDRGTPLSRRGWFALACVNIGADLALIYALMLALRHRRVGAPPVADLLLYALVLGVWYVSNRRLRRVTHHGFSRGVDALSGDVIARLSALPADAFEALDPAQLSMRLTRDAERVAAADTHVLSAVHGIVRLGLGAGFVLVIAPGMAAPAAAALVALAVVIAAQSRATREGLARVAADETAVDRMLDAWVRGILPIKQHAGRAADLGARFAALSQRIRALREHVFGTLAFREYAGNALLYGVIGVNILVLPAVLAVDTESIRDVNLVLVRIVFSVIGVAFCAPEIGAARDALDRLDALGRGDPQRPVEPDAAVDAAAARLAGFSRVALRGASWTYRAAGGHPGACIGPVDIELRRGEVVFLVGENGGGKSTVFKMLTGLYTPREGALAVDGRALGPDERAAWRSLVAPVFTHHHLFEQPFAEPPERARVDALLREAGLDGVTDIRDGRVTRLDLSTGQRKRLALVIERLRDRPVIALDEWAADQEPGHRRDFYRRVLPALAAEGRLVVVVSHDEAFFDCADRVVRIGDGRVLSVERPGEAP